jgi:hypothetical protein
VSVSRLAPIRQATASRPIPSWMGFQDGGKVYMDDVVL